MIGGGVILVFKFVKQIVTGDGKIEIRTFRNVNKNNNYISDLYMITITKILYHIEKILQVLIFERKYIII